MRYAGIIYDDTAAASGLSLSLFTQGCPLHCKGCHNPETWDFNGGYEYNKEVRQRIIDKLIANGVLRNLCIMGGEPLIKQNLAELYVLIDLVRKTYPTIQIYIWTGYTLKELSDREANEPELRNLLSQIDVLVTGRYVEELRDISNPMCGSSNQEIIYYHRNNND